MTWIVSDVRAPVFIWTYIMCPKLRCCQSEIYQYPIVALMTGTVGGLAQVCLIL